MKVVHIIFNLYLGGSETMLLDIMDCQVRQGHDVSLVLINRGHNDTLLSKVNKQINVVNINRPIGSKNPWYYLKLNVALTKLSPDVVHAHNNRSFAMIKKRKGVKYFITIHDTGLEFTYAENADVVCAISKAVQDDVKRRFGVDAELVYNGIKTGEVAVRLTPQVDKREFGMLQISRLVHEKKGQDLLINALALIKERGYDNISLDFVGDGDSKEYLVDLAKRQGVSENVHFLGEKTRGEVYEMIKSYDLLVQPSRNEGFGLTIVEAMAAKVPVLVSRNEGPIEIVDNGRYGTCFENGSVEDCAQHIMEIMTHYDRYDDLARNEAYQRAVKDFDIEKTAERYIEVYSKYIKTTV